MEGRMTLWIAIVLGGLSLTTGFCLGWISPDSVEEVPNSTSKVSPEEKRSTKVRETTAQPVKEKRSQIKNKKVEPPSKVEPKKEESLLTSEKMAELFTYIEKNKSASFEELSRFKVQPNMRSLYDKLLAKGGNREVESGLPPKILLDVLQSILKNAGLNLTKKQNQEAQLLAGEWEEGIERALKSFGENAIQLERELEVISMTDRFLEEVFGLLTDEQVHKLDSLSSDYSEWPLFLSPLTNAPVSRREITSDKLPEIQQGFSRELAREFGLDPEDADHYAAQLFEEIQSSLMFPQKREDIVEHHVAMGEAQIKMMRSLMKHPAIDEQKRKKILSTRYWVVPVLKN